jgi:hypothetical protein
MALAPCLLERHPDVERNQWLVIDDEDGMTREVSFHEVFPARLSAIAGDRRVLESGAAFLRVAMCLKPSINPQYATSVMIDA